MIIILLFNLLIFIVGSIFIFLPKVTIADIPLVGDGVSTLLYSMMGTWNAFLVTFPYAELAWNLLLFVIVPFEIVLIVAKFFLGSRVPANVD